ncbi:TRAP transporter substrate-binding protein DctP [Psychrobacillus sp. OK032]|uniref:TRAP transporter substrate-binding protein DctP n=1 Tax=Psychrobacillus sp. OK032 TaxID=1884358 RepID=UPI0008B570C3|nr:TRAP transporter substrate-binding protein DctP [Psychrobacillus sp. OK032]SER82581.1 TRAP-type C4-dicarboxylate transport system, substrate-binding protein [Psychrobacillus sp. OK032]
MKLLSKKWLIFLFLSVLAFGLAACGNEKEIEVENDTEGKSNEATIDEKVVIKIADYLPMTHMITERGTLPWIERIEELGKGKIEVEFYPAEQLGKVSSMFDNLQNKVTDIAVILPERLEGDIPLSVVGGNLGIVKDSVSGSKAYNKLVQEDLYELEFKPNKIKPLWATLGTSNQITNSKRPVKTLDDIKGLKIRTSNSLQDQILHKWGAVPVSMSGTEIYSSWERGIVDGTLLSFFSWPAYQLDTLAKYTTVNTSVARGIVLFSVNEEVWNSWSKEVQDAVWQASQETAEQFPKIIQEHEEQLMKKYQEETDIEFYELPADELQKWEEDFQSINNKWAETLDVRGFPGTEILEKFTRYNEEFSE